jgi:hypothetical protein
MKSQGMKISPKTLLSLENQRADREKNPSDDVRILDFCIRDFPKASGL